MPFNEIQFGSQHSQKMTIQYVRDNYLRCFMPGYGGKYTKSTVTNQAGQTAVQWESPTYSVDVSRPDGLRRMDYDGSGVYSWVDVNTRKILSGDNSGEHQQVQPNYEVGEEVYVTKLIADPTNTSGNEFSIALYEPTTVDIFVHENREGRNWSISGAGGDGIPTGYEPKCIVFCEGGNEISGQVLFKSGCDDTVEGITASGNTVSPVSGLEEDANVSLYYGPKGDEKIYFAAGYEADEDLLIPDPSIGFGAWLGEGTPLHGFRLSQRSNEIANYALGWFDAKVWQTSGPVLAEYGVSNVPGTDQFTTLTDWATSPDTVNNWAMVSLLAGTKVSTVRVGECSYTLPVVGEKVLASVDVDVGGNKFEATPEGGDSYYLISDSPSSGCFGCGSYYIGIKPSGEDGTTTTSSPTGIVTATGYLATMKDGFRRSKCTEESPNAELASTGNVVLTLGCAGTDMERKVPSITVFGRGSGDFNEVSFVTAGVPDSANGYSSNYPNFDYGSGICLVSVGPYGNPGGTICENVRQGESDFPVAPAGEGFSNFKITFSEGKANQVIVGYSKHDYPIYSWIPHIGTTGLCELNIGDELNRATNRPHREEEGREHQFHMGHLAHRITDNQYYAFKSDVDAPVKSVLHPQCPDGSYDPGTNTVDIITEGEFREAKVRGYDVSSRYKSLFYLKLVHVGWEPWVTYGKDENGEENITETLGYGYHEIVKVTAIGLCPGTPYE